MSIRDDLKAFVDEELSPERMAEIRSVVDADPALRREVEFLRLLGMEIRRLVPQHEVAGRAKAIEAVKMAGWPWWHPYSRFGRLILAGGCAAVLLVVLFPAFFYAKMHTKSAPEGESSVPLEAPGAGQLPPGFAGSVEGLELPSRDAATGVRQLDSEKVASAPPTDGATHYFARGAAGAPKETASPAIPGRARQGSEALREPATALPLLERNRMVIQNADMARRVENVDEAVTATRAMTAQLGGYVESQSTGSPSDRLPRATMVLRIPATRFEEAIERLRSMGEKIHENTNADDVTRQYADVEGRIRVLRAEEESYVTMLRGARRIGEIIEIKDRLSQVRQELASYEQQKLMLKDLSALSTIVVRFEQRVAVGTPEEPTNWAGDAWATAVNGLVGVGRALAKAAIFVFVFAPVWIPPVALFWWLSKKARA